jgi:hypothetical protein
MVQIFHDQDPAIIGFMSYADAHTDGQTFRLVIDTPYRHADLRTP